MKGIGLSKRTAGKVTRLVREIDDGVQERQGAGAGMFPPTSVAIVFPSVPVPGIDGLYRGPVSLCNAADLTFVDYDSVYIFEANEKGLRIDDAYMAIGAGLYNGVPLYVTAMCCDSVEESSSSTDSEFICPPSSSSGTSTSTSSGSSLPSGSSASTCVHGDLCFTINPGYCITADTYRLTYSGGNRWSGSANGWGFVVWQSIDGRYYLQALGPPNIVETPYANYIAGIDFACGGTVVLIPGRYSALCLGCSYPFEIALSADCPSSSSSSSCGTLCCSVGGVVGSVTAEVINGNYCVGETSPGSAVFTGVNFPGGVPDDCHDGVVQIEVSGTTATMLIQDQGGLVQGHYTCSSWHCGGTFVVNTWAGTPAPTEYPETLTVGAVSGCSECDNTPGCGSSSSSASSSSASSSSSTSSSSSASSSSSSSTSSTSSTSSGGSSSAESCPPDCPDCPSGAPLSWSITASGLTAPYESLNGTFELTPDVVECQWVVIPAGGTFWLLSTGGELIGGAGTGMYEIHFSATSPDCCSVMTATYSGFRGVEPVPTPGDITVTPGPCCDPSSLASGGGGISGGGEG